MDMNTRCLQLDLPKRRDTAGSPTAYVSNLACVQNASGGIPLGIISAEAGRLGCILIPSQVGLQTSELEAWQLLRTVLMGATAASVLLISGDSQVDAQARIFQEWMPEQSGQRSNVDLRLQRLVTVKTAFGASNSDIARIFRISRTQLYKWMSTDQAVELEAANWQRLVDLAQIAREWSSISSSPLARFLNDKINDKATLLSLLSAANLDLGAIRSELRKFAAVPPDRSSRHAKLRDAGIKPRPRIGTLSQDE